MAAWLIPVLKAVLPHVGTIISTAKPMFTKPRPGPASNADPSLQQQIAELQAVAAQNDANIRDLAEQFQGTLTALQDAATIAEARAQRLLRLCWAAVGVSVFAVGLSLYVLMMR